MTKKKFKVNVLDFLVIAAVIICIAGAFLRSNAESTDEKLETQTAVISFYINNVQAESVKSFKDGDRVYSESLGCELGKMIGSSVIATPAINYVDDGGKIQKVLSSPTRVDIRGSFECEGQMSESGFLLGGTQYIAPGVSTLAYLPDINVNILITDVKLK